MKTLIAQFIFCTAALFLSGCSDSHETDVAEQQATAGKTLTIQAPDATPEQQPVIRQAGQLLFDVCDGLKKHAVDIESVEASVGEFSTRNNGWMKGITFTIKISENPTRIPREWYAQGHNLFYTVVGGKQPGIDVGKSTAGWFCGVGKTTPFIDDPKAAIVDQLT